MEYQPAYQPTSPSKSETTHSLRQLGISLREMYQSGYDDGTEDGYRNGKEDGYNKGYKEGYEQGAEDGYHRGYMFGLIAGVASLVSVFTVAVLTRPKPSSR